MRVSVDARKLWMWMWNDAYVNVRNEAWMASRKPEGLTFVNIARCTSEMEELLKVDVVRRLSTSEVAQLQAEQPPTDGVWHPDVDESDDYEDYIDPEDSISDRTQAWLASALERLDKAHQDLMTSRPDDLIAPHAHQGVAFLVEDFQTAWPILTGKPLPFPRVQEKGAG